MKHLTTTSLAAIVAAMMTYSAALAEVQSLPTPLIEEVMVKTSLLTLNDANLTGNYDVMHAKMPRHFATGSAPTP